MTFNRRNLNKLLLLLAIALGGTAVWLSGLPPVGFRDKENMSTSGIPETNDSLLNPNKSDMLVSEVRLPSNEEDGAANSSRNYESTPSVKETLKATGFSDVDPAELISNHPFRKEALKILNNHLEEFDSISRRKILSYCEHLRSSYTTKDIDFIRQVFSDNALIIVGNVVRNGKRASGGYDSKVAYAVRSKQAYLERLEDIFKSNKKIDVKFSDFNILRHPSVKGLYGVTLRQKYATDKYSDDGYLFLLWDFRNPSMPQIHVRTWQPHKIIAQGEELIDISDFNIE